MSNIVGLTETKAFMQVTGTATDTLISTYIDITEAEVDALVGRPLGRATYTESLSYLQSTFDQSGVTLLDAGQDSPNLFLRNYPVISLTLTDDAVIPTTSYSVDLANGVISDIYPNRPTATYVAGYTTATAPADLKGLVMMGVTSLYNNNGAASNGGGGTAQVTSKRIKDFSVSYDNTQNSYTTWNSGSFVKNYISSNMHIIRKYQRITV